MRDRFRIFIEHLLPWWNAEREAARNHHSELILASSRVTRARATRVMRMRDGYHRYGERVRR